MPGKRSEKAKGVTRKAKKSASRKSSLSKSNPRNQGALSRPFDVLQTLVDLSLNAVWEYDIASGTIQWSRSAFKILNFRSNKKLGITLDFFLAHFPDVDRKQLTKKLAECIEKKKSFKTTHRFRNEKGDTRAITISGAISETRSPTTKRITGTCFYNSDITALAKELESWKTRHNLACASANIMLYDYDIPSGNIIWSGDTISIVGFTPEEMGRIELWAQLIHPEDHDSAYAALELARKKQIPYDVYYRFKTKGNGYCHIHDRGMFISAKGVSTRMIGMMNDVTERLKSELIVLQSEKSYRELFNSVGEGIFIMNLEGRFLDVNQECCNMYGYDKSEFKSLTPTEISAHDKNDINRIHQYFELAKDGRVTSFDWWGKKKTGSIFLNEVKLTKGTYNGQDIIIGTARDITAKRQAHLAVQESEKRFRRLIEDLNVGVLLHGPSTEILIANRAALVLLGMSEDQIKGKTPFDPYWKVVREDGSEFPPEEHPASIAAQRGLPVRGVVMGFYRAHHDDFIWLLVNAEPTLLDNESLLHVVVTFADITERKKIEEALKESENRFKTLQEASFGGIALHDKGMILDCNQGLSTLTGYSYEELIGMNGLLLIAPEFVDEVVDKIKKGYDKPYDAEGVKKDGSRYFIEIHGKNIPYNQGIIRVTEFRDITDRKLFEAQMLEQNKKLISLTEDLKLRNEQLQEFAQIVSHNLRSPVGNILSIVNLLENSQEDVERHELIQLLKESTGSTLTTLQELNEVLQITQNKKIEKQLLHFERVVDNVKRMLNANIAKSGAVITTDFEEAPSIKYPNIYLESIMLNLISNALKYAHPERAPQISIKTSLQDGSIVLSVSDNGLGINMDRYAHQIFKLRKTFHRHSESRGIGLFMIKNQIVAMGGDISVSSIENVGSTFTINFSNA